jgi:beta-N-acetylhexosaminidase
MTKKLFMPVLAMLAFFPLMAQESLPSDSMLRREAARMLMVGFRGDQIDDNSDAARYVRDLHVGSIVLFDVDLTTDGPRKIGTRNITTKERLIKLTHQLQSYADEPLIIAADQEGGMVCRLKPEYGFKPTVNALYLGTQDNRDTTLYYAMRIAQEMKESGVNLNLAPVLDIHRDDGPHLGHFKRCFSTDVDVITRNAGWFIDAHYKYGILCAVKHFPGHGSALGDSHEGMVDVTNYWSPSELTPFEKLIAKNKVDVVMTAHIYNRRIDPDYPATLSYKTITELLRNNLHYDGVVVTDDMYMEGILSQHSIPEAFALAINAGADILLVGNNIDTGFEADRPFKLVDIIVNLVKTGKVPYQRIHESSERILRLKKRLE